MSWIFACGLRFNRKSQPCIYFRWFALHFRVKTYAKKQPATGRFAGFIVRENNRFLLLGVFDNRLQKALRKKIQGCDFLLNRRPHVKIQLIWTKKKSRPKFDIEWLCSKVFNFNYDYKLPGFKPHTQTPLRNVLYNVGSGLITRILQY